jgi:hypothetical protein
MGLGMITLLTAAAGLTLGAGRADARPGHPTARATCDVTSCTVDGALEAACPCSDADTHGQYVRCVAHAVKGLVRSGVIGRHCRGRVVRLAAHAVCGRPDAIVCLLPTSTCGANGSCTDDPSIDCADDTDCGTRCTVGTQAECDAGNGLEPDVGSCVFASCASPSGAFLDGARTF